MSKSTAGAAMSAAARRASGQASMSTQAVDAVTERVLEAVSTFDVGAAAG